MAETFGEALRRLRARARLSQTALAHRVHISQATLSRYESGLLAGDEATAELLDAVLGADGELLASWSPLDTGPLNSDQRDAIAHSVRNPSRIGPAAVQALADSLAAQRRLDDVLGPEPLLAAAVVQADMVTSILREASGTVRQQLAAVASEHAQFAGWLHAEARHDGEAVRLLGDAEDLADEADDGTLAAQAANFRGYIARQQARPRAMVRWFLAAYGTPGAHVSQRIGDAVQAAQGYARLGERDTALRLLDDADALTDDAEPPGTAYWLTPTFHRLNSGLAHAALGDYDVAVDHLQTGLGNLPDDQQAAEWTGEYRDGLESARAAR